MTAHGRSESPRCIAVVLLAGFAGGGAEHVVRTLLDPPLDGFDTVLVTNTPPSADAYPPRFDVQREVLGVDVDETSVFRGGVVRGLLSAVRLWTRMRATLRDRDVDVVVSLLTTANLLTILASVGLGVRVIVSERSNPDRQPQPMPIRIARWLCYRFADVVTANSVAAVDAMRAYVPAAKLAFVPNAVVLPTSPADVAVNRSILMVGRFHPLKNHALVIDAFARSGVAAQGWTLDFAGDGERRDELQAHAVALGVGGAVRMRGFVDDLAEVYAAAGMLVIASDYEGTPNAVLEALAAGVPCVVAANLDGAVAAMGDAGRTFGAHDVDDLSDQLRLLADDSDMRQQLGAIGRARMAAHDSDVIRDRWRALIAGEAP